MNSRTHEFGPAAALVLVGALTLFVPTSILADGGNGHLHDGGDSMMYFDPSTITTLAGTLINGGGNWDPWGNGNHTGGGMDFEFEADSGETFELMLAPEWFLNDNGIDLNTGERITVTGSIVDEYDDGKHNGGGNHNDGGDHGGGGMMGNDEHRYLIATKLQADGKTLALRDTDGYPLWRGGPDWMGSHWFDPDSETTMTGSLTDMLGLWSAWGNGNHTGNGMHYVFDSSSGESFYAMLGPWWFMKGQGVAMDSGKQVELHGSIVDSYWGKYGDHRFFIASEVHVNGKTVQLRDDWGYPLWKGTGWHYYNPGWTAKNKTTVQGEIVKVRRKKHGRFQDKGLEVVVRSQDGLHTMFVAPYWDTKHLGLKLRRGQQVMVQGSMDRRSGANEMTVQYLEAAGKRWTFRKNNGSPLWVKGAK